MVVGVNRLAQSLSSLESPPPPGYGSRSICPGGQVDASATVLREEWRLDAAAGS
jgi:hypothetical protein